MSITAVGTQAGGVTVDNDLNAPRAFGSNVTAGNRIVVVAMKVYGDPTTYDFVAGDCTKSAGTATLGAITLDKTISVFDSGNSAYIYVGIWSAAVTGTGSCTMNVTTSVIGGAAYWVLASAEYTSSVGAIIVGATNAATATTGAPDSGSVTPAKYDAVLVGGLALPALTATTITPDAAFTTIYEEENGDAHMIGSAIRRIISSGSDSASWTAPTTLYSAAAVVAYTETATAIAVGAGSIVMHGLALTTAMTVALGVGALAFTGQVVTPLSNMAPLPGAGSLVWHGLAPSADITSPNQPSPGAGSLVWHGLIPTVRVGDVFLDIPAGSLVFKGPARPQELPQLQAGSLAWSGLTPQVVVSGGGTSPTIGIPAGSLVWHSDAPLRLVNTTALLGAGVLTFAGQYVAIAFEGPGVGSLVWQGLTPIALVNTQGSIAIPAGSLVWHGLANVINWGTSIPVGSLVFHGLAPDSGQTSSIAIPAGALLFTGQTPLAVKDIPIVLGVGRLIYTSDQGVIPHIDIFTAMGAGSLLFTGQTPTVGIGVSDTIVDVGAGSLVFTGLAPALLPSVEIFPGAGSLLFTGQTMVVLNGLTVAPDAGGLVFTGQVMVAQVLSPFVFSAGHLAWQGQLMRVRNSGIGQGGDSQYYWLYLY